MRRAPTVVVALSAALTELVLVAAAGNQWVVDHLVRHEKPSELPRNRELKDVLTGFPWRWTPESHQRMVWLGEIVAVVGLVIAVFLLMLAFVGPMRPPRRFVVVFLGAWGIVVALTQVAAIGRALLAYSDLDKNTVDPEHLGRWWFGVFDGPTAETVLFGAASGLIVAIVVGLVAALTGRGTDEDDDAGTPAADDEVPAWSAAIGAPQSYGATQALGTGSGYGATQNLDTGSDYATTQAFGTSERSRSERPPSDSTASEPTRSLPPPNPADRVTGWPEPESTVRMDRPAAPESTTRVEPPTGRDATTSEPKSGEPPAWSNVTRSTSEPPGQYSEPPTEITLPRAPQPTTELPPPGSVPPSSRLPLPEEHESDE